MRLLYNHPQLSRSLASCFPSNSESLTVCTTSPNELLYWLCYALTRVKETGTHVELSWHRIQIRPAVRQQRRLTSDKCLIDIFSTDKHSSFVICSSSIHNKAPALSAPGHGHERWQKAVVAMSTAVLIHSDAEVIPCRQPNIYLLWIQWIQCDMRVFCFLGPRVSIVELF